MALTNDQAGQSGMQSKRHLGLTVVLAVTAFLALIVVLVWWQHSEAESVPALEVTVTPTEIQGERGHLQIGDTKPGSEGERELVRRQELRRALDILSHDADAPRRRSAALRLRYLADSSAEARMVHLLNDPDEVVAQRCADALAELWQQSGSPRVNQFLRQGLAACEAGDYQMALDLLNACVELDPNVPDLYRLRAEIQLELGRPHEALQDCQQAVRLKADNFLAHCAMARCYLNLRDAQAALNSVNTALRIYGSFQKAKQLKEEILSRQSSGQL